MVNKCLGDMGDRTLEKLISLVHKHTGITLHINKRDMLQGRVRPRIHELKLVGYDDYLKYLETTPGEVPHFVDLVTTNETYFYRTPRIWEYYFQKFLPEWFQAHPNTTLRVWSAAASSGEEAHTAALLAQAFKDAHPTFQYQVLATDISKEILSVGEKGIYSERSVQGFRTHFPAVFQRYVKETAEGFEVKPEIHQKIRFLRHNLFEPLKLGYHFHIVFLRNVLIYFVPKDQEKVLTVLRQTMDSSGLLIIGESESLNSLKVPFEYIGPLFYRPKEEG